MHQKSGQAPEKEPEWPVNVTQQQQSLDKCKLNKKVIFHFTPKRLTGP